MSNIDRNQLYNELPLLPPRVELETPEVLRAVISASGVLDELEAMGGALPSQSISTPDWVMNLPGLGAGRAGFATEGTVVIRAREKSLL